MINNLSQEEQLLYYAKNGNIDELKILLSSSNININYQKVIYIMLYYI
jgi:hypothetical protein